MIYIYRFLWLVGYVPVFMISIFAFILTIFTYPIVGAFYFIKTGNAENIPYEPILPLVWLDDKYKKLLNFMKKE